MKIQSVNSLYIPKVNNKIFSFSSQINSQDCFVPSFSSRKQELADSVLNSRMKIDVDFYTKLCSKEKSAVFSTTSEHIKKAAKDTVKIAKHLKKKLDKQYGKNNYVFVSIGTSPACIGRALEFSGVETKYLPISDLAEEEATNSFIASNKQGVEVYQDFLNSQGITNKKLENPKKHFLFYDYTIKGTSLRKYKSILKNVFDISTKSDKVEFRSINNDLFQIASEKLFVNPQKFVDYLSYYMAKSYGCVYCGVPHLHYGKLETINKAVLQEETDTAKRFNFMVMSELENEGLLKHNPLNENCI